MQNSKILEVPTQEKRVIKNVCKELLEPPLFLMHLHLYLLFSLSFCNLNFLF